MSRRGNGQRCSDVATPRPLASRVNAPTWAAFWLSALVACGDGGPQEPVALRVVVDSSLSAQTELAELRVEVAGRGSEEIRLVSDTSELPARTSGAAKISGLPLSFDIARRGEGAEKVTVEVEGRSAAGQSLGTVRARVELPTGPARVLTMWLTAACDPECFVGCEGICPSSPNACGLDVDVDTLPLLGASREFELARPLPEAGNLDCPREAEADSGMDGRADLDGGADGGEGGADAAHDGPVDGSPDARVDSGVGDAQPDTTDSDGSDSDASDGDASDGATEDARQDADAGADLCSRSSNGPHPLWGRMEHAVARMRDDRTCPFLVQFDYWGTGPDRTAQGYLDGVLRTPANAGGTPADLVGLTVRYLNAALRVGNEEDETDQTAPLLAEVLDDADLRATAQPVWLSVEEVATDSSTFAEALLDELLGRHGEYSRPCRPTLVIARTPAARPAVARTHELLWEQEAYASLRDHLVFGVAIYPASVSTGLSAIEAAHQDGFELVELWARGRHLAPLATHARSLGLVVVGGSNVDGVTGAALCGVVDAVGAPGMVPQARNRLAASQLVLEVDAARAPQSTTSLQYLVEGAPRTVTLDAEVASFSEQDPSSADYRRLRFDASQEQSLPLAGTETLGNLNADTAILLSVRFGTTTLPAGERQAIVSKLDGDTGWALEIANDGAGTELRFVVHADADTGGPVVSRTSASLASLNDTDTYVVHATLTAGSWLGLYLEQQGQERPLGDGATVTGLRVNGRPVTLGADPGGGAGHFSGEVRLLMMTQAY